MGLARHLARTSALIAIYLALHAAPAEAHQSSMSYSDAVISDDQTRVDYALRLNIRDLGEPLGLGSETTPSIAQVEARFEPLLDYVLERIELETGDIHCTLLRGTGSIIEQRDSFAELRWSLRCPKAIRSFAIEYDLFFDLDPLHTANLRVTLRDEIAVAPLQGDLRRFSWEDLGSPAPTSYWRFIRLGIEHILTGFDHICFLIGLLLVSVVFGPRDAAKTRRPVAAIRYTLTIVTAFTIAHSVTLISAAMGWISLPSRLVESLIAVSIIYVAIENVLRPEPRHRWLLTFGFGLIHGLGFASVLRNLLPPEQIVGPLLTFNVGVELGQLGIVALLAPILYVLASRLFGPNRYRRNVVAFGSGGIGTLALLWLIERIFEVSIL